MNVDKIPHGSYCYDQNGTCPYWGIEDDSPGRENGDCYFLKKSDADLNGGMLWDQVKECGINECYMDQIDDNTWGCNVCGEIY